MIVIALVYRIQCGSAQSGAADRSSSATMYYCCIALLGRNTHSHCLTRTIHCRCRCRCRSTALNRPTAEVQSGSQSVEGAMSRDIQSVIATAGETVVERHCPVGAQCAPCAYLRVCTDCDNSNSNGNNNSNNTLAPQRTVVVRSEVQRRQRQH